MLQAAKNEGQTVGGVYALRANCYAPTPGGYASGGDGGVGQVFEGKSLSTAKNMCYSTDIKNSRSLLHRVEVPSL